MIANMTSVSLAQGSIVSFAIDGGALVRNDNYQILGTDSGNTPGQSFGTPAKQVPLNPSPYFTTTLNTPAAVGFINSQGVLSSASIGNGLIQTGGLAPGCYHFSAITFNGTTSSMSGSGNWVPLSVLP